MLWHDQIHESQDLTRLEYWRLSFSPTYERDEIFRSLRELFRHRGITSYVIYETLGDYDLLLRIWVPRSVAEDDLEVDFEEILRSLRLWNINYIVCHTDLHWADVETDADYWPALDNPVIAEVSEFNARQLDGEAMPRGEKIEGLVEHGVLKPVPIDMRGIRFFVIFDHPRVSFNRGSRNHARSAIKDACKAVADKWDHDYPDLPPSQVSIYAGTGPMTEFLVMARAPYGYFHAFVGEVLGALRSRGLDEQYDMRPYTYVIADQMFSAFAEERPALGVDGAAGLDIGEEETESLEYKATFALNLRTFLETGRQELDKRIVHGLVRATCGLLNSPNGGRLVIGVLETRRELERTKDKLGYLARLREQFGFEIESDEIEDPPNALIGIEAEVGQDRLFPDDDAYQRRIQDVLREQISPNPIPFTTLEIRRQDERKVCVIAIKPGTTWFWGRDLENRHDEFFVREAGSTRAYSGVDGELFRKAHPRD